MQPVKGFVCECGKSFRDKTDYSRHQNRKTSCIIQIINKTDYQCSKCNKYFSSTSNLNKHVKKCDYIQPIVIKEKKEVVEDFYLEDAVVAMPMRDYKWYVNAVVVKI